jgi:hypothetical protein
MKETGLRYAIRVEGHLAPQRLRHFEGLIVHREATSQTELVGRFRDQSALFGLLNWLQSLNVPLLSVQRMEESSISSKEENDGENHVCKGS